MIFTDFVNRIQKGHKIILIVVFALLAGSALLPLIISMHIGGAYIGWMIFLVILSIVSVVMTRNLYKTFYKMCETACASTYEQMDALLEHAVRFDSTEGIDRRCYVTDDYVIRFGTYRVYPRADISKLECYESVHDDHISYCITLQTSSHGRETITFRKRRVRDQMYQLLTGGRM